MMIEWECGDIAERETLHCLLPQENRYKVSRYEVFPSKYPDIIVEKQFNCDMDINICTEDKAMQFIQEFELNTNTRYNKFKSDFKASQWSDKVEISGSRKCQHNIRQRINLVTGEYRKEKTKGKNQHCKSMISFSLKKHTCQGDNCEEFPLHVRLKYRHSHNIDTTIADSYHPVSTQTKLRFQEYFESGLSAAAAWRHHKSNLREEYQEKYADIEANRAFCPDYTWVQHEHTKYLHMKFGTLDGPDAMLRAKNIAEKYNTENGSEYVKVVQREDGHYYIVIVDQLHRRVHEVNIYIIYFVWPRNYHPSAHKLLRRCPSHRNNQ